MIDSFVLLAPIYLVGVIALLGFVGCGFSIHGKPAGPVLRCTADDHTVELSWDSVTDANLYYVKRREEGGTYPEFGEPVLGSTIYHDTDVTNGTVYYYVVLAIIARGSELAESTSDSNEVKALPLGSFVTTVTPVDLGVRNGLCGMRILVGPSDLTIYTLGRSVALGMTMAHEMKVIDATSNAELGSASVDPNSQLVGDFRYGELVPADASIEHVKLIAGREYYVMSMEMVGGDQFYDRNTTVTTRPEATVQSAVYTDNAVPGVYTVVAGPDHTIGPVSFQY